MKAFLSVLAICISIYATETFAQTINPATLPINTYENIPSTMIDLIRQRGEVRCGTNIKAQSFAYKEDDIWHGIDADICRVIAQAVLGDNKKIAMVHTEPSQVADMLNKHQIDVMLSGSSYPATMETSHKALNVGLLYYDHQFLMINQDASENLKDYKNKKICLSNDGSYFNNFDNFNNTNELEIKYLTFSNIELARQAFLLKRCQMLSASGLELHGMLKSMPNLKAKIIRQDIAIHPVYAFVQKDAYEWQMVLKWIFNALLLAEQYNINAQNLDFYATNDNIEIRNLLGDNKKMWENLHLKPNWLRETIAVLGNYGDIYERNLGEKSDFQIERKEGNLVKNGGTICPIPFI